MSAFATDRDRINLYCPTIDAALTYGWVPHDVRPAAQTMVDAARRAEESRNRTSRRWDWSQPAQQSQTPPWYAPLTDFHRNNAAFTSGSDARLYQVCTAEGGHTMMCKEGQLLGQLINEVQEEVDETAVRKLEVHHAIEYLCHGGVWTVTPLELLLTPCLHFRNSLEAQAFYRRRRNLPVIVS